MYATHLEQLNIGIFVCGSSETLPTCPLVLPELTGNATRWAQTGCGVVDVDGGVRGFLQSGRGRSVWVVRWAKWDEAVQAAEKQIFTLIFALYPKPNRRR